MTTSSDREPSAIEDAVYDERRVQDAVLALMHLNAHADRLGWRAWKTFPWEATDGLDERLLSALGASGQRRSTKGVGTALACCSRTNYTPLHGPPNQPPSA